MTGFYGLLAGNKGRTKVLALAITHILYPIYATSLIVFLEC